MFLTGITLAILGALFGLPAMRARLHADLAHQGDLLLILYLGFFVSTILVGPVIDSFGNKAVMIVSAICVVAGLFGLFPFVLGLGGGGLNTASNALVADLYPEKRGAMLNVIAVFFGIGAFITPMIVEWNAQALTIAALVCAIAFPFVRFPAPRESTRFSLFASIRAARNPAVILFALLLFCESGNEAAIGGWTSTYAGSIGAPPQIATLILTAYWAGLMLGRIGGARILSMIRKESLVFACAVGSAIGTAVLYASRALPMIGVGAAIIGLSFSAIYPTTLAIAADRYQRQAGTIFGFLFAAGLVGGMLFPFAIGHLSAHFGLHAAMLLPVLGAVVILVIAVRVRSSSSSSSSW
jgi:MFS transporter, FHS family, glucose/mannose:H+ symporter